MPLLLTEADVRSVLTMPDLIAAMEPALAAFSSGAVVQPVRTVLDLADRHAFFGLMPAYVPSLPALGAKLVTVYHSNLERGLPSHLATILLFDPATGDLEAIVDGRYITEARTAAVSAVSAKKLARPDAKILAILGSGVQARSHFEALNCVCKFDEIRVWSPTLENSRKFAAETGSIVKASAEEAARGADVIALVTASSTPVVHGDWIKPGTHVIAVGACRPTEREMDSALVARARLFVDSRAAALKEAGDIVIPIQEGRITADHIVAELGESTAARQSREEVTIFKSLGLAVEDVASAHLAATRARRNSKGASV
ncbi:MAG TPA: ornithine cyclodeaminase family protein [Bryobacteraceae bacterium]|nr:ornithine cyclodeaminase family protein [Bryobacteraceae bacterium]